MAQLGEEKDSLLIFIVLWNLTLLPKLFWPFTCVIPGHFSPTHIAPTRIVNPFKAVEMCRICYWAQITKIPPTGEDEPELSQNITSAILHF